MTGHEAEAREALQRYLALPSSRTQDDRGVEGVQRQLVNANTDPRFLEYLDRQIEGLRKAGMPEE